MYKDHETPRFWISYGELLKTYIEKNVADKNAVNDILHEVYLKIFTYCQRFDFCCDKARVKNLRAWVFRVCHNTIVDYHKQRAKFSYGFETNLVTELEGERQVFDAPLSLDELLKKIPAKYAEAVWYDSVVQLNQSAIADKLGLSISATKSRVQRGKKMLRAIYEQQL
ncbi:sigma-70 family RNA polymerase sigma factor [Terrimonas alba]|uniref:sigma-70 family RNA polymerase sigma factor n=1 Tax=Terrimonas alba TaxID=3349636 RepID=UPI0035F30672